MKTVSFPILLVCLLGLSACAPIGYAVKINVAESAINRAREAGAPQSAPYEYYYAVENLDKAREVAARADYQAAWSLADEAIRSGDEALELSRRRGREGGQQP